VPRETIDELIQKGVINPVGSPTKNYRRKNDLDSLENYPCKDGQRVDPMTGLSMGAC